MISRALDRVLVRGGNIPSNSKRFQACVERADEKGITLFGMDEKRCWTSDDAEQSYDRFEPSGDCKKKNGKASGFAESLTVFVYQKDNQGGMFYSTQKMFYSTRSKDDKQSTNIF